MTAEAEWRTRKRRIDPRLDAAGWSLVKAKQPSGTWAYRSEEEETDNGPADYALWDGDRIVGVAEAKKLTVGPQGVLTQAARYARGLRQDHFNFQGYKAPFLYSTNGEVIYFHDVRHPLNTSRQIAAFHTPGALRELVDFDLDNACDLLRRSPNSHPLLRPYQAGANAGIENAIADRKRHLLVAMATGTGKTFTMVNQAYRLLKSGAAKRILFLVDRRALAAQAVRAFASFEAEPGKKFDQIYEVYSSRFQKDDFEEDEAFDPKVLPKKYLTDPRPGHAFVYVCTIQRMAINILGRNALVGLTEEQIDADAEQFDIPIHAFDLVIADECHRGYTAGEVSDWRATLDHFDAIKIGLTATPAKHTTAYFTHKVFEYSYEEAVRDGYLVDYDVVKVRSNVRMEGVFLHEGEGVEYVDPATGLSRLDQLEDERTFDTSDVEAKVTSPDSNRKILEELRKYTGEHELRYGRVPKTLIFAVNDLPHTSHADQLVAMARQVFGLGEAFVAKITGRVDRPLQRIREFRNRPQPSIAVTVDLLSTGVDIPDLEFIVFLRPVKSRILFTQMLGRGTRKGEKYPDKSHFTVFDCFDGSLLEYFKDTTDMTGDLPAPPARTVAEIIDDIWANRDRDYNVGCLVKRLQRVDKEMSAEARNLFADWIPEGDVAKFARGLRGALKKDFSGVMQLLRDPKFQRLLVEYPRPPRTFLKAYEHEDTVSSTYLVRDAFGHGHKPADYLEVFNCYVRENPDEIDAIRILLDRPQDWQPGALAELQAKLARTEYRFTTDNLRRVHELHYRKALVDIISMVKHAAREEAPLLTADERTARAFDRVVAGKSFTTQESAWLERIRQHLRVNLSINREDFDQMPVFADSGGWMAARVTFGNGRLDALLHELNREIAA